MKWKSLKSIYLTTTTKNYHIPYIAGGYALHGGAGLATLSLGHAAGASSSSSSSSTTYHGKLAQSGHLSGSAGVDLSSSLYRYASAAPATVVATKYLAPSAGTLKAGLTAAVAPAGGYKVLTEDHLEYYVSA